MALEVIRSYVLFIAAPMFFVTVAVVSSQRSLLIPALYSVLMVSLMLYHSSEVTGHVKFSLDKNTAFVGDSLAAEVDLELSGPPGMVILSAPPASYLEASESSRYREGFDVENGRSSRFYFKGFAPLRRSWKYDVTLLKRGLYNFGRVNYVHIGVMHARSYERSEDGGLKLTVLPRYAIVRKKSWRLKPMLTVPRVTRNRVGPYSTEFVSVRKYMAGDPFKFINWKATARSSNSEIMVNEFEKEGLRNVVFVMDVHRWMRLGTPQKNPMELSMPLILSLTSAFLDHDYNVGLWTFPSTSTFIMPSSGQAQFHKILEAMLSLSFHAWEETDAGALLSFRRVASETNAHVVVISNLVSPEAVAELTETMLLDGLSTRSTVIDIIHTSVIVKRELQAEFPDVSMTSFVPDRQRIYALLPKGISVISWDPELQGMGVVIQKLMNSMGWYS
jgi:uncharacterized protein (DUF58 family)